ncbi:hypothetical protein IMCC26134_03575 [Verrucomicrobia bacterium IMCC26134]|nr:hypothetical protein IMCC26134_03575 [Verrucomicrobia bacterium IMCC26134]
MKSLRMIFGFIGLMAFAATPRAAAVAPTVHLAADWPVFMARQDLVWDRLPDRFESAAFTGNGLLGAMVFTGDDGQSIKWQQGRTDVEFMGRIPIGDLVLTPVGKILGGDMRLDLWNAEVRGTIKTDRGEIQFRTFTHSDQMVEVFETIATGGEQARWSWAPGLAANARKVYKKEALLPEDQNAPPVRSREGEIELSFQPLRADRGHATAWQIIDAGNGRAMVYASVGYAPQEAVAKSAALAAVQHAVSAGLASLAESHHAWWHRFWPEGFISIPDARLESFYYIQMYKMASATRPSRPALDLMGPWFRSTPWPKIWWNLNIQLAYWPQLTGNRLELGQSLCELIDRGTPALIANAKEFSADSAGVGRVTGYDCGSLVSFEICNLPWAMHNYWLQYRYCMDDAMLRDRVFPMLKRSINYYLHLLVEGPDGKLHLSSGYSPEYPKQPKVNPDTNIDLSLLRWGCQTLLETCGRLKVNDAQIPVWKNTLAKLTPYPTDQNGLMISALVPFAESHRHYSHLLMIYPLYLMTPEQPENRELVIKSLKHWMSMPKALQGYSYTGASSISSLLGEGDESWRYLNKLLDTKIPPNTLYGESGPCIETPLSAAASVNDMLLSSWGDRIRVFPGVPKEWQEVSFNTLRAQGAFLVSATRQQGKTQFIHIQSLAGEPCRIRNDFSEPVKCIGPATVNLREQDGVIQLDLKRGESAVLYSGKTPPSLSISPLAAKPDQMNAWGLKNAK